MAAEAQAVPAVSQERATNIRTLAARPTRPLEAVVWGVTARMRTRTRKAQ
jgi:hypothetical protein